MKLKLKQSIRNGGKPYRANTEIDTKELNISDAEANVLLARGVAVRVDDQAPAPSAPAAPAPEVVSLDLGKTDEAGKEDEQTGQLAGVVTKDGEVVALADMTKADLLEIAKGMDIEGASSMNKAQLVAAIEAVQVVVSSKDTETDQE